MYLANGFNEQAWVAVGNPENWERGLENGIWGIVSELAHHWQKLGRNDLVLFYCKSPISRFFGAGVIRAKFKQTSPFWREEIEAGRIIWPYRFEFDPLCVLPIEQWKTSGISNRALNLSVLGGLNPVADFSKALNVLNTLGALVGPAVSRDTDLIGIIQDMGKIQRMVVESKYPVDQYQLDVIWKRTIRSVPTYAFSVLTPPVVDKAISPLKHAYDLWNSRPFLIADAGMVDTAREVIMGAGHEFSSAVKILTAAQINELYASKKNYYDLEARYGLR